MRRNGQIWFARWSVILVALMFLSACSVTGGDDDKDDGASTNVPGGESAAIGCWTDDQRISEGSAGVAKQYAQPPAMAIDVEKTYTAEVVTNFGSFTAEFYPKDAPKTVNNFVCLARDGYYTNTPIHRIVSGFVIQGGDPTGTGAGGPGYRFEDETIPSHLNYQKGTLAMANAGPNTNGSQFFVVLGDLSRSLPKNYTIFGQVTSGIETVDKIAAVKVARGRSGENSTPQEAVTIESVTITES